MKKFLRKSITWIMILLLSVGTIGTFLPGKLSTAEASETTEKPKYMLKMTYRADGKGQDNKSDNRVGQYIDVVAGTTYTVSFDVYSVNNYNGGGNRNLLFTWGKENNGPTRIMCWNISGQHSMTAEFTADSSGKIYVSFQANTEASYFYIWNIKITKQNENTNLLNNPNFETSNGSLVDWCYSGYEGGDYVEIKEVIASDNYENRSGRKVLVYNEELFSQNITNRDELEITGDSIYMAHLYGEQAKGKWIYQTIPVEEEAATYTLSYTYYKSSTDNLQSRLGITQTDPDDYTEEQKKQYRTVGNDLSKGETVTTKTVTYEKPAGNQELFVKFEVIGYTVAGTKEWKELFLWDITLTKNEEETNLLKNANFIQDGGSWIGWNVSGDVKTLEDSNKKSISTGCEIIEYDTSLFNDEDDIAKWSVQPILEDTLDFNYKVTLKDAVAENPTMTFTMKNGAEDVKTETVTGVKIEENNSTGYTFSFEVLPQQMGYNITATLNVGEQTEAKTYSVKKYCASILANDEHSQYLKDLVADLLRYGDATQKQLELAETITSGLSSFMTNYGSTANLENDNTHLTTLLNGDNNGAYTWKSASLVLNGKVVIRLKFQAKNGVDGLSVKVGEQSYEISKTGSDYYIDIPMAAATFANTVTAKFQTEEGQQGASLQYSVNTYLFRNRAKSGFEELMDTIYKYGKSADIYYEYVTTGKVESTVTTGLDNEWIDDWEL